MQENILDEHFLSPEEIADFPSPTEGDMTEDVIEQRLRNLHCMDYAVKSRCLRLAPMANPPSGYLCQGKIGISCHMDKHVPCFSWVAFLPAIRHRETIHKV